MNPAVDPRSLDFYDSLNPLLLNQYAPTIRPSDYATLESPLYVALRKAATYEPYIQIVPEGDDTVQISGRQTYEGRFYVPHGSFLYALSTSSSEAAGFAMNVYDLGNGGALFPQPIGNDLAAAGTSPEGVSTTQLLLQRPRAILAPGLLSGHLTNRATGNNRIQLALWFMVPESGEVQHVPNEYDRQLQAEVVNQSRVSRPLYTGGGSLTLPNGQAFTGPFPWGEMPPGGRPARFEQRAAVPAAGTSDFPVLQVTVPNGYTWAIKHHRHNYTGPGFAEASGDLTWRIDIDGLQAPGFDAMTTTAGTQSQWEEIDGALIATAGQTVRYTVSVAPGAVMPEATVCGLRGFFYPA